MYECFCGLAQILGVPHLPQRLPSSPRQHNSPFHILVRPLLHMLIFPPRYTKFWVCSNSCPSTSRRHFLFRSPRNWHSVFCVFIFMPMHLLANLHVLLLSASSLIPFLERV